MRGSQQIHLHNFNSPAVGRIEMYVVILSTYEFLLFSLQNVYGKYVLMNEAEIGGYACEIWTNTLFYCLYVSLFLLFGLERQFATVTTCFSFYLISRSPDMYDVFCLFLWMFNVLSYTIHMQCELNTFLHVWEECGSANTRNINANWMPVF